MEDRPLVQWSFLQFKKTAKSTKAGVSLPTPSPCFLHSSTQIGSKVLIYGGCDYFGEALNQLFIYDTENFQWSAPSDAESAFQEDQGGGRYGHSAVLVEMHPPKIMIYGGMVGGGTFEFDAPDTVDDDKESDHMERKFMTNRKRQGKKSSSLEEPDDSVYFLSLNADKWIWSKPLISGGKDAKPLARCEHSAVKCGTNEVLIFGGWTHRPSNDMWTFNFVDMEWKPVTSSGIQPRSRYRHTAEVLGTSMFILGGSENGDDIPDGSRQLSIHELNLQTMSWTHPTLKGVNPFPRSGHGSAVIGAKSIAVFGGKRTNEIFLNDLVLIDTETFSTTIINAVESHLPTPITNSTLSVVGNKCFVFGGTDTKGVCYNDIRLLDIGYYLSADDITVGQGASSDYNFKIIIIGDASVGKSALLTRFSENVFLDSYSSTIGIDFNSRMIRVDGNICKLEIWDTAGQERFSTITANYYRGAQGALLVYDVGLKDSFDHVKTWYERAQLLGGENLETILIGNKCDIPATQRQVSSLDAELLAGELKTPMMETSALNGYNVEAAFVRMTKDIKASIDKRGLAGIKNKGGNLQNGTVTLSEKESNMSTMSKCGCGK